MLDDNAIRALILSVAAGMSTLIGAAIVFVSNKKNEKMLAISLGFAAGVMMCVSFTDLFPQSDAMLTVYAGQLWGHLLSVLFLILGMVLAGVLDKLVPHEEYDESTGEKPHKNLFRVGFVSMLAIGLHNFPEGIATFMAGYDDMALGITIAVAITMHNIPEGISVAMPIYYATGSKGKAFKYTFLSGIAEPIGAMLAFLILRPFINDLLMGAIFAVVAGIMLYIAIEELIPSSRQYGYDRHALIATFAGICIMPLSHII